MTTAGSTTTTGGTTTGGTTTGGQAGAGGGVNRAAADAHCGCRTPGRTTGPGAWLALFAIALGAFRRRNRR
jgi:MYXO-CTERM domain-containing protein